MKRVAILVETALASGRSILAGISQYLHEHDDWSVFHPTGHIGSMELGGLEHWAGDGIIARISNPRVLEMVRQKGVPVVDVLGNQPDAGYPLVKCDDAAIGRLVAEHFLSSGHRRFAFFGLEDERWSLEREQAFRERCAQRTGDFHSLRIRQSGPDAGQWNRHLEQLTGWLSALPSPLALMVASDQFGPLVMKACQRLGRAIPDEVSIVGVDNDLPFCELCRPRLSSVEPNHSRVGYEAARLMDAILAGSDHSTRLIQTPPLTLHHRLSSDATAVDDPALVRALQFIRREACHGISLDDVAAAAGLSRSVLQRRFRAQLGRTIGDTINDMKLLRAREMLSFTDLPLLDVAERSGFTYQEYLTAVFKKHLGTTPARYRQATRSN